MRPRKPKHNHKKSRKNKTPTVHATHVANALLGHIDSMMKKIPKLDQTQTIQSGKV